ncbi:carbohydrate ABC transporter membrane protein 2, CUT1 family [Austwickia chelonae]|uniref:Putative ABC transporter permease protein n=1 Tax=Austwickia chelonae NBRC 105200 TaxID=1184607 RepID=K6V6P2_9MICO|nr:sugar ABC transporter permease [Austwickia chelonae]GAB77898.1 putative ABC transporter permease protein [Austwickia chelonae NBRC 105200]SEV91777.1 carbohydrate ABC transporter membrane protein 2, CUT1 family [Austwickia chelonae]
MTASAHPTRVHRLRGLWWRYLLIVFVLAWTLFPVVFVVSAAVDPAGNLVTSSLWPSAASTDNLRDLLSDPHHPFLAWYRTSLVVAGVASVATVFLSACAAYAFSRLRFPGRRPGLFGLLLVQMFPAILSFVALYSTFAAVGDAIPALGLGTPAGLILAYLGGAMGANVWLLKGYFDTLPRELDEAAVLDGCSHLRIFLGITLRLARPVLVTVLMVSFVSVYSEFLLAGIFLTDPDRQTLAVGLNAMMRADRHQYLGQFAVGALLSSAPVLLIYLVFQRQLVSGLTRGSLR